MKNAALLLFGFFMLIVTFITPLQMKSGSTAYEQGYNGGLVGAKIFFLGLAIYSIYKGAKGLSKKAQENITAPSLASDTVALTEEEAMEEVKQKKTIAWVLFANSAIGIGVTIWLVTKGVQDPFLSANIIPWIIDISIAVGLLQKKDLLKAVFVRSLLGLIFWVGISIGKHDWLGAMAQVLFSVYLLYHSRVKATKKSFKIALVLLVIAWVSYIGVFSYGFQKGKAEVKKFDAELTTLVLKVNSNFEIETKYLNTNTSNYSHEELQGIFTDLLNAANVQKADIAIATEKTQVGLAKYKDTMSQKSLTYINSILTAENEQNNAIIEFASYAKSLDYATITQSQWDEFQKKYGAIDTAQKKINSVVR